MLDRDCAVLDPSELRQSSDISGSPRTPDRGGCPTTQEAYGRDLLLPPRWSLRARRERPRHRAPNHFDEIASPHIGTPSPGRELYPPRQELDRGRKTVGAVHSRCLGKQPTLIGPAVERHRGDRRRRSCPRTRFSGTSTARRPAATTQQPPRAVARRR